MTTNFLDPKQSKAFLTEHFASEPARLEHILTVAEKVFESAKKLARTYPELDPNLALCAALVHDIGYIECAKRTGFHPIDGYNFLKEQGFEELADLIVGHSNSLEQAILRGIEGVFISDHIIAKLITYWDSQVKQGGEVVSYEQRLADIVERYGNDSVVTEAHRLAQPRITGIIKEIEGLLPH